MGLRRQARHRGNASVLDHVQHQPDTGHIRDQIAASVAEEGQRNARDGHPPRGHAHVFKYVEQQHPHHPQNDHLAEAVGGIAGQIHHAQDNQQIDDDHRRAAHKAPCLADGGENEVRPVLGHVVQLAEAALHKHAHALQPAGADGDLGLGDLISSAFVHQLGAQEAQNSGQAVVIRAGGHGNAVKQRHRDGARRHDAHQRADADAAEEHHHAENENHD